MTPVNQRNKDDCMKCCIATIFDLPYERVPQFGESAIGKKNVALVQDTDFRNWLDAHGLSYSGMTNPEILLEAGKSARAPWGFCIGSGPSPRGDWFHSVVYDCRGSTKAGSIPAFDPHPSRDGIKGRVQTFECFYLEDPSLFIKSMK